MKRSFRSITLIIPLLFMWAGIYGQNLDLIITNKGDSIACRIDSINDTHIYFEMRSQGARIHTHVAKEDIVEYRREAIDRKDFIFEAGSSVIKSPRSELTSMQNIRRNSVYVGVMTLMYARMFPVDKVGITLGAGIFNFDGWGLLAESTVLVGGVMHYFEPGIMIYQFIEPDEIYNEAGNQIIETKYYSGLTFRAGYRYQGPKGLLIRGAANLVYYNGELMLWPALSLGYSF